MSLSKSGIHLQPSNYYSSEATEVLKILGVGDIRPKFGNNPKRSTGPV